MNKRNLLITAVSVASLAGGVGVVSAATHSDPPITTQTVKSATVETTPTVTQEAASVDTQPAQGQTERATPIASTPIVSLADQNKSQLQQAITEAANATIAATNQPNANLFIQDQLACINKFITNGTGYNVDYNTLLSNSAYVVLLPIHNADGTTTYRHFEGLGSCTVVSVTV